MSRPSFRFVLVMLFAIGFVSIAGSLPSAEGVPPAPVDTIATAVSLMPDCDDSGAGETTESHHCQQIGGAVAALLSSAETDPPIYTVAPVPGYMVVLLGRAARPEPPPPKVNLA